MWLCENVPGVTWDEVTRKFNEYFGTNCNLTQVKSHCKKNRILNGRDCKFKKGQASGLKGSKMTDQQYMKAQPTMFKPGHKPPNTLPIGTEKMLSDGYIWVKVDNQPKVKKQVNWKQKHRLIYEQHYGNLDDNQKVIFLDGDKLNFNIENLMAVTLEEQGAIHKFRGQGADITKAAAYNARLDKAIKEKRNKIKRGGKHG